MKKLIKEVIERIKFLRYFLSFKIIPLEGEVFISFDSLRRCDDIKLPIKSALKKISHKIGEELLSSGMFLIQSENDFKNKGKIIKIAVLGVRINKSESLEELCAKLMNKRKIEEISELSELKKIEIAAKSMARKMHPLGKFKEE